MSTKSVLRERNSPSTFLGGLVEVRSCPHFSVSVFYKPKMQNDNPVVLNAVQEGKKEAGVPENLYIFTPN